MRSVKKNNPYAVVFQRSIGFSLRKKEEKGKGKRIIAMLKVLIADENKDIRFLIQMYLRDYEIEFIEARDGEECLELIKTESPRLLILNYMLNKLSGYQVAEEVYRASLLKNSVIIMTLEGFDLAKDKVGVDEYLAKPFSREQLIEIIKKVAGEEFLKKRIDGTGIVKSESVKRTVAYKEEQIENRKKILIADDEPNILKLLELILKKDYDVKTAASGEELIEKVEAGEEYDLIISDVVMPKLSGWKSIKEIRKKGYNMPVIFNSGLVKDKELYETLKPSGISLFILKPFNRAQILTAVKELL